MHLGREGTDLSASDACELLHACCADQHINIHRPVLVHARACVPSNQPHRLPIRLGQPYFLQQAGKAARTHPALAWGARPETLGLDQISLATLKRHPTNDSGGHDLDNVTNYFKLGKSCERGRPLGSTQRCSM